jgi:hypothetical protein
MPRKYIVITTHLESRSYTLSVRETLNDDPDFRWCRHSGRESGQIHGSGVDGDIFLCIVCGVKVCVVHDDTWHEGEMCGEYDYRKWDRPVMAISQLAKKCPRNGGKCGWNIEKNGGCDRMACTFSFPIYGIDRK